MANIDTAIANVAAPSIQSTLHASSGQLELIISGYVLAYGMILTAGARLGDMLGYRKVFVAGLGIFTVASLTCGLSHGANALIAARVIQGVGAGLMVAQVLLGIQRNFTADVRARALGLYALTLSGSAVIGQILGGALVSANIFGAAWRPVFLINVPIGIVLIAVAVFALPRSDGGPPQRLDFAGIASISGALLLLTLPLTLGQDLGWPAWTWACLTASVPAFAFAIDLENRIAARGGTPIVRLDVFRAAGVAWGLLALAVSFSTYAALLFVIALFLQQGLGESALYTGLAMVSWVAAFGAGGYFVSRLPPRAASFAAPIGFLILTVAFAGISAVVFAGRLAPPILVALLAAGGLGFGCRNALVSRLTRAVESRNAPDLSGLITTTSPVAGALGIAVFGGAYFALAAHGAQHAFATIAGLFAMTALLSAVAAYRCELACTQGAAALN